MAFKLPISTASLASLAPTVSTIAATWPVPAQIVDCPSERASAIA
ncbi:hypothetical protein [Phytomonospora endophytica]|uniref:Uncharacterized protein n=1 Tax=Phytomonospora endophytica TaxID=714109 RepID=A0A841FIV1_9ACTN|nr:hypothetical protein [Phytomonospora endophytica]MBB6033758.1 hypothetical protein [Phytomonospora endophytica]